MSKPSQARFIGTLDLRDIDPVHGIWFQALSRFAFQDRRGKVWEIQPGDVVNGASIPRFAWSIIGSPMTGHYRRAACLHDAAYQHKPATRWRCDRMFLEAMQLGGEEPWRAWLMWFCVRQFGGDPWAKARTEHNKLVALAISRRHDAPVCGSQSRAGGDKSFFHRA